MYTGRILGLTGPDFSPVGRAVPVHRLGHIDLTVMFHRVDCGYKQLNLVKYI